MIKMEYQYEFEIRIMVNDLNFEKQDGLIPAIVQDTETDKVLMLGFMNKKALDETQKLKKVTFYSRSKQRLWTKGETSGNYLIVKDIIPDCDNDTLLIKATPMGPVCHKGQDTCFNEENVNTFNLKTLELIIKNRKENPKQGSYTNQLFEAGTKKIGQKVGEEAVELILETGENTNENFLNEAADLMYHFLVLLQAKDVSLEDVERRLAERHK